MDAITKKNIKFNLFNMEKVCYLLGVKINEVFKIQFFNHKAPYVHNVYKITEQGLFYSYPNQDIWTKGTGLEGLLTGKHQVVKISV